MLTQKRVQLGVIGAGLLIVVGIGALLIQRNRDISQSDTQKVDASQLRRDGTDMSATAEAYSQSADAAEELSGDYHEQSGYYFYQVQDYKKALESYKRALEEYEKQEGRERDVRRVQARVVEMENQINIVGQDGNGE